MSKKSAAKIEITDYEDEIPLQNCTVNELEGLGSMNSTYDDVVQELLQHCDSCQEFWKDR